MLNMSSKRTQFRKKAAKRKRDGLIRVRKGYYIEASEAQGLEGDFYRATLALNNPSIICLNSALQYFGLSEQMLGGVWIMIPYEQTAPKTTNIRAVRSRHVQPRTGIMMLKNFRITNLERTLVDLFRYRRLVGIQTAVQSLRQSLQKKMTTKSKVLEMAKKLGATKTLLPYLEAI